MFTAAIEEANLAEEAAQASQEAQAEARECEAMARQPWSRPLCWRSDLKLKCARLKIFCSLAPAAFGLLWWKASR
jgi:hypothetical protein